MAHGILQSLDADLQVYSGGTKPAERVNPKAVEAMNEIGLDISHHTPHNVSKYLNEPWDYVITVCGDANESCPAFVGTVAHRLHIGFDDPSDAVGSQEFITSQFRRVRDQIKARFTEFYNTEVKK